MFYVGGGCLNTYSDGDSNTGKKKTLIKFKKVQVKKWWANLSSMLKKIFYYMPDFCIKVTTKKRLCFLNDYIKISDFYDITMNAEQ